MRIVLLVLALATVALTLPVLQAPPGAILGSSAPDVSYFFAQHVYAGERLRTGELPLWNPHILAGAPFLANFQSAVLYPPHLLRLLAPGATGFNLIAILHLFLAAAGAALCAAQAGIARPGQLVAGLAFAWSAPFVTHAYAGHQSIVATYTWTGFVATALLRLCARPAFGRVLLLAVLLAVQCLAGYVQCWYYVVLAAAAAWLAALVAAARRGDRGACRRLAVAFPAALALALLLAAPQLLPTLEFARVSARTGMPVTVAAGFAATPESLLSFIIPAPFGDGLDVPYWGRYYHWELCAYSGVITLLLAAVACRRGAPARCRFFVALLAGSLLLAAGDRTPLFRFAYEVLPGFAWFRGHAKLFGLAAFALAQLAGYGCDRLRAVRHRRAVPVIACAALLLLLPLVVFTSPAGAAWQSVLQAMAARHTPYTPAINPADSGFARAALAALHRQCLIAAVFAGLLALVPLAPPRWRSLLAVALLLADLGSFARPYLTTVDTALPAGAARLLARLPAAPGAPYRILAPDLPVAFGTRERRDNVQGNDAILAGNYFHYLTVSQGVRPSQEWSATPPLARFSPLTDRLNLRVLLVRGMAEPPPGLTRAAGDGDWQVWENPAAAPRFTLTGAARVLPRAAILPALALLPAGETVCVEPPFAVALTGTAGSCTVLAAGPEYTRLAAAGNGTMLLVERSTWYPGWTATVDGAAAALLPVDYLFRGVVVPAGEHHVEIRYRPRSFAAGLMLAVAALAVMLLGWLLRRRRRAANGQESSDCTAGNGTG